MRYDWMIRPVLWDHHADSLKPAAGQTA